LQKILGVGLLGGLGGCVRQRKTVLYVGSGVFTGGGSVVAVITFVLFLCINGTISP